MEDKWEEIALAAEVGFSENGQAALRHGRGRRRPRTATAGRTVRGQRRSGDVLALQNNENEDFSDVAHKHGVAQATRLLSGWGLKFFDYDNDGAWI